MPLKFQSSLKRPAPVVVAKPGDTPLMDQLVNQRVSEKTAGIRADAARSMFINKNMGDLPETYRAQMPPSEDQAVLAAAEQQIRSAYREDMRTHMPFHVGYSEVTGIPSAGGPPVDNIRQQMGRAQALAEQARANGETPVKAETPAPQPDLNNMSSTQLFALGLKQQDQPAKTNSVGRGGGGGVSKVETMPTNYVGMSSQALISMALRGMK